MSKLYSWNSLSWKKSQNNLYFLQKRIFKSILVGDIKRALRIQKLIIYSNSARLLAIREVTQVHLSRKISGIDGKTYLTFTERFELSEILRISFYDWKFQHKKVPFFCEETILLLNVFTVSDRAWQCLVRFTLEPVHEATFHPRNFGFRDCFSIHDIQRVLFFNLKASSYGIQKRVLIVNFFESFSVKNFDFVMEKFLAPKGMKKCIFFLLKGGLQLVFLSNSLNWMNILGSLFLNIILNGIESIHSCVRFGFKNGFFSSSFFLKPKDDEKQIFKKVIFFLKKVGLRFNRVSFLLASSVKGFDFLGWNFKVQKESKLYCIPSFKNYQNFQSKVKFIINNSNFGSKAKAIKLYPIVYNWRIYHKFSNLNTNSKYSLFFLQQRAFKTFNKETKQNRFSTKRLLNKAFPNIRSSKQNITLKMLSSPYFGHLMYCKIFRDKVFLYCVYCGFLRLEYTVDLID
uniref:Type II intron reverse transcrptase/maturase Ycf13/mat1 n=1 Tax=Eutreptiella sp. CCMP389 TaxID=96781 RepID=A0A977PJE2_9EUGL|nr:type II intron reverse transcrptase/maturase Ycf13/mat1 [Eutreptiella sp. CCMP389]